jgi:hypothetical protein
VEGDELVCPFHGWRFDVEGRNVAIPYSGRPNRRAALGVLPTTEANGIVFAWHGPEGEAPSFEPPMLPEASDDRFVRVRGERFRLRTHVQEVMENTVDAAHFEFVHKTHGFGTPTVVEDGPMLRSTAPVVFVTPKGDVQGEVVSELWGLGIDVVRPRGITEAAVIFGVTPVDDEEVEAGYTFYVTKGPDGGPSRVGQGLIRDFDKQVTQDAPIWEHKCYRPVPALAAEERAITRFRRWAAQFHGTDASGPKGAVAAGGSQGRERATATGRGRREAGA